MESNLYIDRIFNNKDEAIDFLVDIENAKMKTNGDWDEDEAWIDPAEKIVKIFNQYYGNTNPKQIHVRWHLTWLTPDFFRKAETEIRKFIPGNTSRFIREYTKELGYNLSGNTIDAILDEVIKYHED